MENQIINLNKGLFETIQEAIKELPIGESKKTIACKDGIYDAIIIIDGDGTFCYTADKNENLCVVSMSYAEESGAIVYDEQIMPKNAVDAAKKINNTVEEVKNG